MLGDDDDAEPIPISALQHAVYCLRRCALIHIERVWAENRLTAEGRVLHKETDEPARRSSRGVSRISALPLASRRLAIAGVADLAEFRHVGGVEIAYPWNSSVERRSRIVPTRFSSACRRSASKR